MSSDQLPNCRAFFELAMFIIASLRGAAKTVVSTVRGGESDDTAMMDGVELEDAE